MPQIQISKGGRPDISHHGHWCSGERTFEMFLLQES